MGGGDGSATGGEVSAIEGEGRREGSDRAGEDTGRAGGEDKRGCRASGRRGKGIGCVEERTERARERKEGLEP